MVARYKFNNAQAIADVINYLTNQQIPAGLSATQQRRFVAKCGHFSTNNNRLYAIQTSQTEEIPFNVIEELDRHIQAFNRDFE